MAPTATLRIPSGLQMLPTLRAAPCLIHHRFNSNNNSPPAPHTAHLECERKFRPTAVLRTHLQAGHTINKLLFTKRPTKTFQDKYFDIGDRLFDRGIWLRLRTKTPEVAQSGVWEAKVRIGKKSDYVNSKFEEVSGEREVYTAIKKRLPNFSFAVLKLLGYQEITAAMETEREIWVTKDADLQIVLDKISAVPLSAVEKEVILEHVVGEIEVTSTLQMCDNSKLNDVIKKVELTRMDSLIERFMVDQELFSTEPAPVGKLSAYFEWKKRVDVEGKRQEIEAAKKKFFRKE